MSEEAKNSLETKADPTPSFGEKRRSSVIEDEHMFGAISQERPLSRPTPSGKIRLSIEEDANNSGNLDAMLQQNTRGNKGENGIGENTIEPYISRPDMYKEAIYTGAHYLGVPSPLRYPSDKDAICVYAHEIFSENEKEQLEVIEHVRNEPFPLTIVNAKVRRGSGLQGAKPGAMLDSYCVVTIETENASVVFELDRKEWQDMSTASPAVRKHLTKSLRPPPDQREMQVYEDVPASIKTGLQRNTNNPRWDQRFQCLSLRPSVDKITVEVWDHSVDDKAVAKAINNVEKPTNVTKSLEAARDNIDRKKGDTFLGKVSVKVSEITCDGSDKWYMLTRSSKTKDTEAQGKIRLQIWLVHAYRHGRHYKELAEPKVMLGHLWDFVLAAEKSKFKEPKKWNGSIPSAATCLLFQYALQNGISEDCHAIIRWNAYAKHDLAMSGLKDVPPVENESKNGVEENVMRIVTDKIIPIIRNHLNEPLDRVQWALTSYRNCVEILEKYKNTQAQAKILWMVQSAMRMCILEWYQQTYSNLVPQQGYVDKGQYVGSLVEVIKEVNSLIRLGEVKFSPEFWLKASIEYQPVIYDELQKMVIHDVEAICWLFFQFYRDSKKLRTILLHNEDKDRLFCTAFLNLFKQTQTFVLAQVDIFKGVAEYPFLAHYHRWFRPTLVLWLGFTLIRGSLMICKTIHIDTHVQDPMLSGLTSSSALDTANVFAQLVQFWMSLQWPDIPEGYVIINFLMEVICSYTVLYAELKHAKLEKEGYYDPSGRFSISERLCTALNNIEYVKEQMERMSTEIDQKNLLKQLEEACGKSPNVVVYEERAQLRLEKTVQLVDKHIDRILLKVGGKITKEISGLIKESYRVLQDVDDSRLGDSLAPLKAYLDGNIVILDKTLLPSNFHKVLQLIWNMVFKAMHDTANTVTFDSIETQAMLFDRVIKVIPDLKDYFKGGDAGLTKDDMDTQQYAEACDLFSHFTKQTENLILLYFHERGQFHLNYRGKSPLGTLRVRIGYWNDKLSVEVLSASRLTPHDHDFTILRYFHTKHPTSDAKVEMELRPLLYFGNEKRASTQVKWRNLNPTFEETFYWAIKSDECRREAATLVFTVKDYDLLSSNAFLGEALVPLHIIPGISESPEPQPMVLTLHEVDMENHALVVLQSRKWDDRARQFSNEQLGKIVEPIPRKR